MPRRASSPAPSDGGFDITEALFGGDDDALSRLGDDGKAHDGVPDTISMGDASDDEAVIAEHQSTANRKASNLKGRTVRKGGGFQALGLNANLFKAITRKGFSVPTPIQRKTIPLLLNEKDVVGMARTGSGKTAAFIIPMIEKLKAHSTKVGARALILSPSRELALQTLQVVKDLGRGTDLRSVLLVGGDSLEEQFGSMVSNPDVIIATPGRFLHLKVEMSLELSSMRYVVFDEADRLFEMGFAAQLTEILHALPAARQTLLFSATLPKSLVEFARAGLQDPILVRLDADSKISSDLQNAFFTVKSSEKEGALLHILQDIIKVPAGAKLIEKPYKAESDEENPKKRKRHQTGRSSAPRDKISPFSTIIFTATKHHVEYLGQLLRLAGYSVSHIYGSLDQTARKEQIQAFRSGQTNILVVTDVAARGIDIPVLAHVINYDFPSQPKIFVHRVGRTARAGQRGWSYSILHDADAPYLLDLQLFLGRKLQVGRAEKDKVNFTEELVVGSLQRDNMQVCGEWVNKILETDGDMALSRSVASKGEKLYQRTRNAASSESAKRARELIASNGWTELHPLCNDKPNDMEFRREKMLAVVGGFRPQESVFEISARRGGRKANEEAMEVMQKVRSVLEEKRQKSRKKNVDVLHVQENNARLSEDEEDERVPMEDISIASDSELAVTFSYPQSRGRKSHNLDPEDALQAFRNLDNFMSYKPVNTNLDEDRAYGIKSGSNSNFTEAARGATMDLGMDEAGKAFGEARGIMRWDKRQKKYVARQNDEDGSKGTRLVKGESGAKIAASFKSGRYDAWRKANKLTHAPRVGEAEPAGGAADGMTGKRYRHKTMQAPKAADKFRKDYDFRKKKVAAAKERSRSDLGKKELRSVDDIRKQRGLKEKRREKNARPQKRKAR